LAKLEEIFATIDSTKTIYSAKAIYSAKTIEMIVKTRVE